MAKKLGIEKKLNVIIKDSENFLNKKNYTNAIRKLREGLSLIRTKVKDNEEKQEELERLKSRMDEIYKIQIDFTINHSNDLGNEKDFENALDEFNKAITLTYNISEPQERENETNKIENAKNRVQFLLEIDNCFKLSQEKQFDKAIKQLDETLEKAINTLNPKDDLIKKIKNDIVKAYSGKINSIIQEGNDFIKKERFEEALNTYKKGFDAVNEISDENQKKKEKENLEYKINEALSNQNNVILQRGKEMLADGNIREAENELNKALNNIERMYHSDLKKKQIDKIAELINPIYLNKVKPHIEEANQIISKEGFEDSIIDVNKAIDILKNALELSKKMAKSKEKSNNIDILTKLINDTCMKAIKPRKKEGILLIEQKQFDDAIRELYSAISLAKNLIYPEEENIELNSLKDIVNQVYLAEAEDVLNHGNILLDENKIEEALETYNKALSVTNKMYLSEEMDGEINKIKNLIYQTELKQIIRKGEISEEEKKLEEEIERLNQLIQASSSISDPEKKAQRLDELRAEIDNVHVERIDLLIEQANQLAEQNKYDIAYEYFEKCLSIAGFIHFSTIKENELAIIIDNYIIELNNRARQEIKNENHQNVLELCNKAIELDDSNVESYYNLGNMYKQSNNIDKAIEYYQKTFGLEPYHSNAYNDLGIVYANSNEMDKAIDSFKRAIEVDTRHARAWFNLGNAYRIKEENKQAIHAFNKAIEIEPNYAEAWFLLGKINFIKKEYHLAIEQLDKAIELKPELGKIIDPMIKELKSLITQIEEKFIEL